MTLTPLSAALQMVGLQSRAYDHRRTYMSIWAFYMSRRSFQ